MLSDKIIPLIKDKQKDFLVGGKLDADQITSYLKSNEREFSRHKNTPLKIAVGQGNLFFCEIIELKNIN